MLIHAELLTGVSLTHWHEKIGDRRQGFMKFMNAFWHSDEFARANKTKKGATAAQMQKLLAEASAANTAQGTQTCSTAAMFPLLCGYMNEDWTHMVEIVPVSAES